MIILLRYSLRGIFFEIFHSKLTKKNAYRTRAPGEVIDLVSGGKDVTTLLSRGCARKNSWGVSGLQLPSKICELKCYKPKLPNLFSTYKPNAFQKYKVSTLERDTRGSGSLPPEKFSMLACSGTSENALC